MIAGGAAAHSDHGRSVAEVFMSAARKESDAYKIKDVTVKLLAAPHLGVDTTVEVDGEVKDGTSTKSPWKQRKSPSMNGVKPKVNCYT
jgi:hypothetical protein